MNFIGNIKRNWNKSRMLDPRYVPFSRRQAVKLVIVIFLSVLSYFFISRYVVTAVEVKGNSMLPTLAGGERRLLNRWTFLYRGPQRGDLVVLKDPETGEFAVKRVVGLPDDTVQMKRNIAHLNGHLLAEPYLPVGIEKEVAVLETPVKVPKDHYFVLGDNRGNSMDSRNYGPVARANILGLIKP